MSSANPEENSENTCVVCFKSVEIFSIGECDHPVCYECSTRMRVLCRQNECPICRQEMPKVIFTKRVRPYRELKNGHYLADRKFRIEFDEATIRQAYDALLAHRCSLCPSPLSFQNFSVLKEHMRRSHELFYCELCVANLMILTCERRCYTRRELERHERTGDPDDKSHKGHPLCEFCDARYMDKDDLCRHLRRDHLFCHFCDADGYNYYYGNYESLRDHFRNDHFLCEEGTCYEEKFTAVFRTEIDLRAHRASVHGRTIGKAATKQARTLELAFKLTPRPNEHRRRGGGGGGGGAGGPPSSMYHDYGFEEGAVGYDAGGHSYNYGRYNNGNNNNNYQQQQRPTSAVDINTDCINEFPTLDGKSGSGNNGAAKTMMIRTAVQQIGGGKQLAVTDENFPALGPEAATTLSLRLNSAASGGGGSSAADRAKSISQVMKAKPPNVSIHVTNHRAPNNLNRKPHHDFTYDDVFPSLGADSHLPDNIKLPHNVRQLNPEWSSGRNVESKIGVVSSNHQNETKSKANPPKQQQNFSVHDEKNFPTLSVRFQSGCTVKNEPPSTARNGSTSKNNANRKTKPSSTLTFPAPSAASAVKSHLNNGNVSSDSDVGSKIINNNKKKKKTGKSGGANNCSTQKERPNSVPDESSMSSTNKESDFNEVKAGKKKAAKNRMSTKVPHESSSSTMETSTMERKRTELKIGLTNNMCGDDAVGEQTLNDNSSLNAVASAKPPGFVDILRDKPPPGFDGATGTPAPPPGFSSIKLNSVVRTAPANDLTFTNSCGQSFAVKGGGGSSAHAQRHQYIYPVDFGERNSELLVALMTVLSDAQMNEFREMSARFRRGLISPNTYYLHCLQTMGDRFAHIFPELIAQLPDIHKQQELLAEHKLFAGDDDAHASTLKTCAVCGQVVRADNLVLHFSIHSLENNFPSLNNGVATATSSLRAKK